MSARSALTTVRRRLLGVALLMTIVLFLSLTVATYQRVFTSSVDVTLRAASTGNQLLPDSDVKVHGMIVGRVNDIEPTNSGAQMHLAIEPDKAPMIPRNVSARLLPRTLFGERYVSLEPPPNAQGRLTSGQVIEQDRTRASMELETVLADTMPVLQAVHPAELSTTLNALNQALSGRGRPLGETLSQLNTYLDGLNPSVPQLRDDLRQLVGVAETYQQAAPEVLDTLRNLSTTSRTLVDQQQNLDGLTKQLTTTSDDANGFLQANSDNLIRFGESARPTMNVLSKYSPEFPCFLDSLANFAPRIDQAFGKGGKEPGLHVTLEVVANRGKYLPGQDDPKFADKRGPRCYDFRNGPNPLPQYPPDGPVQDGTTSPPAPPFPDDARKYVTIPGQPVPTNPASTSSQSAALGVQNSPQDRAMVSGAMAPAMGKPASQLPQWGSLLVGPVLRGAEVDYR